jgi:hypothetical protein
VSEEAEMPSGRLAFATRLVDLIVASILRTSLALSAESAQMAPPTISTKRGKNLTR